MSDRHKIIEETKKQISSLLVCLGAARDKPGIPTRQFHNDYRALIGSVIPYRELGYSCLDDFFRDIPDTVYLTYERGDVLVKLVENNSISHIVKLVNNQKDCVSKKRAKTRRQQPSRSSGWGGGGGGRYGGGGPPRFSGRPGSGFGSGQFRNDRRPIVRPSRFTSHSAPVASNKTSQDGFIQPPKVNTARNETIPTATVPPHIRAMILEMFLSFPNGLLGDHVETAFSKRFGQTLAPNKMGFRNIYTLFCSLKDIVHIEELDDDFRVSQKPLERVNIRNIDSTTSDSAAPREEAPRTKNSPAPVRRTQVYLFEQSDGSTATISSDLKRVLSGHTNGIWVSKFPQMFEAEIGVALPWKEMGFPSVVDFMGELKDFRIVRESARDWKIYSRENDSKEISPSPVKPLMEGMKPEYEESPASPVPGISNEVKEAVRQVIKCHPEGLPLYELPETYRDMTGKPLPMQESGFSEVDLFVQKLSDELVLNMVYQGKGLVLLKPVVASNLDTNFLLNRPGLGTKRKKQIKAKHTTRVPTDAVGANVYYPNLKLTEWKPESFDFEVCVSMVNNPGKFWIQIRGLNTTEALENLMDELEVVYDGDGAQEYEMPDYMVNTGQVCAAVYPNDNNWHRVTIVQINGDFVEVYFVDYGTSCSVHRRMLRLLKSRFLHLPAQALPAKFAGIKPSGGIESWSPRASQRFLELVSNQSVLCAIVNIDKFKVLSICLCDTSGTDDIHIQDKLVEEGLAEMEYAVEEEEVAVQEQLIIQSDQAQHLTTDAAGDRLASGKPTLPAADPSLPVGGADGENVAVAYVSPMKRPGKCSDEDQGEVFFQRNVMLRELTPEHSIHLVNYMDMPYVLSGEISAFFWGKDLLRSMLRQKRIDLPRQVLSLVDHEYLFAEFEEHGISGLHDANDKRKNHLTMYSLENVLTILKHFGSSNDELHDAIVREISLFDPAAPYWTGETDDQDLRSASLSGDSDSYIYNTDELKCILEVWQLRRKKLVNDMVSGEPAPDAVEQLQNIEENIASVRTRIKEKVKRSEGNTEEEFIQKCVEEQYRREAKQRHGVPPGRSRDTTSEQVPPSFNMPNVMNPLSMAAGLDNMASGIPTTAGGQPAAAGLPLTPAQHNFIFQYNMMLSQHMLQNQMMGGAAAGLIPGAMPGMSGSIPGMPGAMPGMPGAMPGMTGAMPTMPGAMPTMTGAMPTMTGSMPGMTGAMPGMPGAMPGMPGTMPGMPGAMPGMAANPMANLQESMAGLSVGDMSSLLLGQGRSTALRNMFPDSSKPGTFNQGTPQ